MSADNPVVPDPQGHLGDVPGPVVRDLERVSPLALDLDSVRLLARGGDGSREALRESVQRWEGAGAADPLQRTAAQRGAVLLADLWGDTAPLRRILDRGGDEWSTAALTAPPHGTPTATDAVLTPYVLRRLDLADAEDPPVPALICIGLRRLEVGDPAQLLDMANGDAGYVARGAALLALARLHPQDPSVLEAAEELCNNRGISGYEMHHPGDLSSIWTSLTTLVAELQEPRPAEQALDLAVRSLELFVTFREAHLLELVDTLPTSSAASGRAVLAGIAGSNAPASRPAHRTLVAEVRGETADPLLAALEHLGPSGLVDRAPSVAFLIETLHDHLAPGDPRTPRYAALSVLRREGRALCLDGDALRGHRTPPWTQVLHEVTALAAPALKVTDAHLEADGEDSWVLSYTLDGSPRQDAVESFGETADLDSWSPPDPPASSRREYGWHDVEDETWVTFTRPGAWERFEEALSGAGFDPDTALDEPELPAPETLVEPVELLRVAELAERFSEPPPRASATGGGNGGGSGARRPWT